MLAICTLLVGRNHILAGVDQLRKSMKCPDYLNVDQLIRQVKILDHTVNLEILDGNLQDSIAMHGDSFLTYVFTNAKVNNTTGRVSFLCSYAVDLFRYVNGTGNAAYFLPE